MRQHGWDKDLIDCREVDKFSTRYFTDEEKARRRAARRVAKGKTPASLIRTTFPIGSDFYQYLVYVPSATSIIYKLVTLCVMVGVAFWCYFS